MIGQISLVLQRCPQYGGVMSIVRPAMPHHPSCSSGSSSSRNRLLVLIRSNNNNYSHHHHHQYRNKSSVPVGTTTFTRPIHVTQPSPTVTVAKGTTIGSTGSGSNTYTTSTITTTAYLMGIGYALMAATAGIVTVSSVANLVEMVTARNGRGVPPLDTSQPLQQQTRYDTTTYSGRFCHMLLQCDPYLLLYSNQQIMDAKDFVDRYYLQQHEEQRKVNDAAVVIGHDVVEQTDFDAKLFDNSASLSTSSLKPSVRSSDSEEEHNYYDQQLHRKLWEMKRIYDSAMNDSGMIIPRPFRMSGYVPCNGPICVAMVSSTTTTALLFWSWINQSQNAFVNYYNRSNSSQPIEMTTFVQSYTIAVTSALCVAFGLATLIQRNCTPARAQLLLRYVAFPSAVVASSLNCYIVRSPELQTGIPLLDVDGNNVMDIAKTAAAAKIVTSGDDNSDGIQEDDTSDGSLSLSKSSVPSDDDTEITTSKIAAARGVYATTASRALLQAPVYFLPPVLVSMLCSKRVQQSPTMVLPITTYLLLCSFGFGLPAACAIYPQTSSIDAKHVEPSFQQLLDPTTQQPYKIFYYDKGL